MPRLTVTVVNYFSADLIRQCLDTLTPADVEAVWIYDNSVSNDQWGELQRVSEEAKVKIFLRRSDRNIGFGAAHNALIRELGQQEGSEDAYIWLLNPDVRVDAEAPASMRAALDANPDAILSSLILNGADRRVWFAGGEIVKSEGRVKHTSFGEPFLSETVDALKTTEFITGAAFGMSLRTWKRLGGFREDLFLYWEDVELSMRAESMGIMLAVAMGSIVEHDEGGTQERTDKLHSRVYYRYNARNRIIVWACWRGARELTRATVAVSTLRCIVQPVRAGGVSAFREFAEALYGTLDGLRIVLTQRKPKGLRLGQSVQPNGKRSNKDLRSVPRIAVFAPTPQGGHPQYVASLLSGLVRASPAPRPEVVWPIRADMEAEYRLDTMNQPEVIAMQTPGDQLSTARRFISRMNLLKRHDVSFLAYVLRNGRFDAILIEEIQQFTLPFLVGLARLRSDRVIVHLHNVIRHDFRHSSILDRFDVKMTGCGLRGADDVLVLSSAIIARAQDVYSSDIKPKVLRHGMTPRVSDAWPPPSKTRLLLFGEMRPNKGIIEFLEQMSQVEFPCVITVAGRADSHMSKLLQECADRDKRIDLNLGFIDSASVPALFRSATAVVLPYRNFEAQSGVLHLAMDYGVPVMGTRSGAVGETIDEWDIGWIIDSVTAECLSSVVEECADDGENWSKRVNAIGFAQSNSWDQVGLELHAVLSGKARGQ